jgi:ppGpp synthetase/RelA/SpoT-type nucleotidyltranferase
MSTEFKKLAIQNRIDRLRARGKENYSIIKKLMRQLNALGD